MWSVQRTEGIKFVTIIGNTDAPLSLLNWRKSGRSGASGNCVELARLPHGSGYMIRNSRNPDGPALIFTADEIAAFLTGVRDGDFDDLVEQSSAAKDAAEDSDMLTCQAEQ
nr:DUF397 domain-containing protein [Allorhizocola rhizosphaerae]